MFEVYECESCYLRLRCESCYLGSKCESFYLQLRCERLEAFAKSVGGWNQLPGVCMLAGVHVRCVNTINVQHVDCNGYMCESG